MCPTCSSGSPPTEKSARERRSNFHSAQQTMRTLLHASDAGDLALAARCLDLDGVPQGGAGELGPILAYKLKFVLDRIGRVALEEIPSEADGPRYYYHRSTLGRIDLVRCAEGIRAGDWLFSRETVAQIEAMFRVAFDRRLAPGLSPDKGIRAGLSPAAGPLALAPEPAARLAQEPSKPGLEVYQWIGLAVRPGGLRGRLVAGTSCPRARRALCTLPGRVRARSGPASLPSCGRWPSSSACGASTSRSGCSTCPSAVFGVAIPAIKIAWIGLMGWTAFRLIDLGHDPLRPKRAAA